MKKTTDTLKRGAEKSSLPSFSEEIMQAARQDLKKFEIESKQSFLRGLEIDRKLDNL